MVEEVLLDVFSTVVVIFGFCKIKQLKFMVEDEDEDSVDIILLIVSLFGLCVYNGFNIISSVSYITTYGLTSILALATAVLAFFQACLQAIFIVDGLKRCAAHDDHVQHKPGRALVTFLLICNISLWIVNTFEVEKAEAAPLHPSFYGKLAWSILSHICLPMLIFFRFHSSVCLSEIWMHAYVIKKKDV